MTFGPPGTEAQGSRVTTLEAYTECLDYLQGEGYNEIDTARVYVGGKQEGWTNEAGWRARGLEIATKVSFLLWWFMGLGRGKTTLRRSSIQGD